MRRAYLSLVFLLAMTAVTFAAPSDQEQQLAKWLKRFPDADLNADGRLSAGEAQAYYRKVGNKPATQPAGKRQGAPREFTVDPGWLADRFPDHAVCYRTPQEIEAIYAKTLEGNQSPIVSHAKPTDGSLRIVGTGHSFMAPGYKTLPLIAQAAGLDQQSLYTHTGGGMTGSVRYKWEQENGIFQFDGNPTPKLLASIANAEWDAMAWGPYFQDQPEYYACWIDFCLKYNPAMKFYLSDAWPQLDQLDEIPTTEAGLTAEIFVQLGQQKRILDAQVVHTLNKKYSGRVFVMPTSDAMVLAAQYYHRGELPGVEGIHTYVGGKERSLWRDRLGHLGPGFGQLEGYVFYATLYGRSPEQLDDISFPGVSDYPSPQLDRVFRKIAWQAVVNNPLSGVTDKDGDGLADKL